jgi:tetratricopeptide (TPR) repeat protein
MKRMIPVLALLAGAAWQAPALAQLQEAAVHLRTAKAPVRGIVKQETAKGIQFIPNGKKEISIPAEDIVDVDYEISSTDTRINKYRPALNKELEIAKAKEGKRAALLAEAVKMYQVLHAALTPKDDVAKRHIEYKVAVLTARLAGEDGLDTTRKAALARLADFRTRHPQSWQLGPTLKFLAELQVKSKLYAEAEETFKALAAAPVSDGLKAYAQLETLQVVIAAGRAARAEGKEEEAVKRFTDAVERLKALAESPKVAKEQQQRSYLAMADMLTELNRTADAQQYAQRVLKDATDKQVRAAAYNALGLSYYRAKQWEEARWKFLWVDVIYNQDKAEHAKALYYLADIYTTLGDGERARECLDQLLTDPEFAGLEFQRRAQRDEEKRAAKDQ